MVNFEDSVAPLDKVPGLDNTDGMRAPGLHHLAHNDHGVLLRVILQYVIRIIIIITFASCSNHVTVILNE